MSAAKISLGRFAARILRSPLTRYMKGGRPAQLPSGPPKVTILLSSAWGMGGTIRAAINLAGWLAPRQEVEIITAYRRREEPFFGDFPEGVVVTPLEDQRPGVKRTLPQRFLRRFPSVLMHSSDRLYDSFTLWSDIQLARMLRGRTGILMGTRPALNFVAASATSPGLVTVGLEQMHHKHHNKALRTAMKTRYRRLNGFVVLTKHDRRSYRRFLKGKVKMARIENTVRWLDGPPADLSSKRVLAAGRLRAQKGFDLLIPAWAKVAAVHPDWTLRICGDGRQQPVLEGLIREHGLEASVELPGPGDMAKEMSEASIFCMSSRFEGFPLILLEAMSKQMAVVSFDCPTGPGDIIEHGTNGLIVPPKDIDALADALIRMMGDEDLRRRCAPAAAETAKLYTMDAIGPRWEEYLDRLWERRTSALAREGGASAPQPREHAVAGAGGEPPRG